MKKFTKILENIESEKFFEIDATIKLKVISDSEGEAGYMGDSILGSIQEQAGFKINNISEVSKDEYQKTFESIESPQWAEIGGYLQRHFEFDDFKQALNFINKIGELAEIEKHHPEIINVYNKVILKLKTHEGNKITEKDHQLAKKIDDLN